MVDKRIEGVYLSLTTTETLEIIMALTTAEIEARIIRLRELVNMGLMEIEAAQYYADRLRRRLTLKERYSI